MGVEMELRAPHTTVVCQRPCAEPQEAGTTSRVTCSRHSGSNNNTFLVRYTSVGIMLFLLLTLFVSDSAAMPRSLLCDRQARCLHGGSLRLPDTPFGFCRCICTGHYVGPRCQFNRNTRIRRVNRLKRLVRMKLQFEQMLNSR